MKNQQLKSFGVVLSIFQRTISEILFDATICQVEVGKKLEKLSVIDSIVLLIDNT